jgi:hypothetical protein
MKTTKCCGKSFKKGSSHEIWFLCFSHILECIEILSRKSDIRHRQISGKISIRCIPSNNKLLEHGI